MKPGTSARNSSGTLNASQSWMKRVALSAESTNSTPPLNIGLFATTPMACPASRAKPTISSRAHSAWISNSESESTIPRTYLRMSNAWRSLTGTSPRRSAGAGSPGVLRGRRVPPAAGEVGQVPAHRRDRVILRFRQVMPAAGDRAVHPRAAHLLERGLLPDHHLDHAGAAQVHRRVPVHHRDEVAERRDVGAARGRGAEQRAHLRDGPGGAHLGVEDLAGSAAAREHLHLVGDPRARRVHQVDHGDGGRVSLLDDPDDLLDGARAPGARLDRRVVRHQRDRAVTDGRRAGDHAVRRQPVGLDVGEGAVLGETALVDEPGDPVPGEQLVPGGGRLVIPDRAARLDLGSELRELGMRQASPSRPAVASFSSSLTLASVLCLPLASGSLRPGWSGYAGPRGAPGTAAGAR